MGRENRIGENARDDFAFNIDDTRPVDIFTAADRGVVKTKAVIVKDDVFTGRSVSDLT